MGPAHSQALGNPEMTPVLILSVGTMMLPSNFTYACTCTVVMHMHPKK